MYSNPSFHRLTTPAEQYGQQYGSYLNPNTQAPDFTCKYS